MAVSPTNLSYEVWQGQSALSNQVEVWNTNGTDAMTFTNTVSYTNCGTLTNWLTVTPTTGISYGAHQGVWLQINMTNMPPRTNAYEANVRVTAGPGTTNSPQNVQVTVLVQGIGLWVSTNNFSKELSAGQAGEDVFQVANTGAPPRGTITYTVAATSLFSSTAWLSVNPTNGSVADNTNPVTVAYATTNLSAGWHTGRVDVVALGVGTQTVDVVLRVNNRPGVAWDAGSKVWTNEVILGSSLTGTNVAVWNASGTPVGQMSYQVYVLNDPFGWVSVSNASGVSTGNQQVVTVSYTTTGLVAGVYTAQLMVEGKDVATGEATTNGPLSVGLQLTVKGSLPVLKTDVTSLSQTVLENHIGTNSFLVWNEGREPRGGMRYTVTSDVSWVTVSPTTGVVTNNQKSLQVVWGTTGTWLPPGVYYGNLVVDAFDVETEIRATGAPLTLPLTLTVTQRTPMNLELPRVVGTLFIGQTVEINVGIWKYQERLTFTYQWERASNKAGGGREVLSGEIGTNYVITATDRGKYLRVAVTATDSEPFPTSPTTAYSAWVDSAKVKALRSDFNGDGITDLWLYDEASGAWHASFGTTNSAEGIFPGGPGMIATPGDYDGDGYEDLGVYERAHGMWYIFFLPRGDYVSGSLLGGTAEEAAATPVPADYDGDGATDVALYLSGYWVIRYSSSGAVVLVQPFAGAAGIPVTGDWDGDGIVEMGVYEDGIWTLRLENGSLVQQALGAKGILPAPGDYDGDGVTDLGVHDVNANQWHWRSSWTGASMSDSFGTRGGCPMQGYYDHDRREDFAQAFSYDNDDLIVWLVKRTAEPIINPSYPYIYHGHSYQLSTDRWRVSW